MRRNRPETTSGGAIRTRENGIADTSTLFLEAVEQATRPNELRGENSESEQNGQPAGARGDDHDHAQGEQSETENDLHEAFRLLKTLNQHGFGRFRSSHSFGCGADTSGAWFLQARALPLNTSATLAKPS